MFHNIAMSPIGCHFRVHRQKRKAMKKINTYQEMNEKIVGLLRLSDNPVELYAAQYIEELQKPRWISVNERLPEKDQEVLVYLFKDRPYLAWLNVDGEWETEEFTIDYDYLPTHWMPLPEPPKEES